MPRSNLKMEDYYDEQLTHEEKKLWPIGFTLPLSTFRHHHCIGCESETVRRKKTEDEKCV